MNLYQFQIVFSVRTVAEARLIQLDKQSYMLHALNEEEALKKALQLAAREEEVICTKEYGKLQWEFEGIDSIKLLNKEEGFYFLGSQTIDPEHFVAVRHGVQLNFNTILEKHELQIEV